MKGYEVTIKVAGVPGALDTFELLAPSHEHAAIEGTRLFRAKHPRFVSYDLETPDVETSELLTKKLLALKAPSEQELRSNKLSQGALVRMLKAQLQLQLESYGKDPRTLDGDERADFVRWNAFALEDEIHEALGEIGWKPWATSRHLNAEAFIKEMVDAWHFFMNLLLVAGGELGLEPDELATMFEDRYFAKRKVNAQRQTDGYDGVSSKCENCHRDLAEVGCRTNVTTDGGKEDESLTCLGCGYEQSGSRVIYGES